MQQDFDRLVTNGPDKLEIEYCFAREGLAGQNALKVLRWNSEGKVQTGWWIDRL